MSALRKIIHLDMDAFYASVEQRDNPAFRGKPLVVGGTPQQRGAVAAASYEARLYGIHSAMPSRLAIQKCRHLIFAPPRFEVYKAISEQIHQIFLYYTDLVEPLALDEAYLEVTINKLDIPSATLIAHQIRAAIFEQTGLTASAGVSYNKFLAKLASGLNKPDGLCVIQPHEAEALVEALPIEQFYGVGKATAERMHALGIRTGADLKQWNEIDLARHFGKHGHFYYQMAHGQDSRPVIPNRSRKSIGVETSFLEDLSDLDVLVEQLRTLSQVLQERLEKNQLAGHTLVLKIKYADLQQLTRSRTVPELLHKAESLFLLGQQLLKSLPPDERHVRLLGLSVSNFPNEEESTIHTDQLTLEFL
jgi:DNA polymerase IV